MPNETYIFNSALTVKFNKLTSNANKKKNSPFPNVKVFTNYFVLLPSAAGRLMSKHNYSHFALCWIILFIWDSYNTCIERHAIPAALVQMLTYRHANKYKLTLKYTMIFFVKNSEMVDVNFFFSNSHWKKNGLMTYFKFVVEYCLTDVTAHAQ